MAGIGEAISKVFDTIGGYVSGGTNAFMAGDKSAPLIKTVGAALGAAAFFQLGGGFAAGGASFAIAALGGLFGIFAGSVINEPIQDLLAKFNKDGDGNSRGLDVVLNQERGQGRVEEQGEAEAIESGFKLNVDGLIIGDGGLDVDDSVAVLTPQKAGDNVGLEVG